MVNPTACMCCLIIRTVPQYQTEESGRGGIRTHERLAPLLVFETSSFNHSDTLPSKSHEEHPDRMADRMPVVAAHTNPHRPHRSRWVESKENLPRGYSRRMISSPICLVLNLPPRSVVP